MTDQKLLQAIDLKKQIDSVTASINRLSAILALVNAGTNTLALTLGDRTGANVEPVDIPKAKALSILNDLIMAGQTRLTNLNAQFAAL